MPVTASELPINNNASAQQMAEAIFGDGVQIVANSASYTGDNRSSGIYTDGDNTSPGVTPGDTGVILTTGRTSAFTRGGGDPNRSGSTTTGSNGVNNDADFNAAAGTSTFDASYLEATIIPDGNMLSMQFVFASEEYPEFVNSIYQDFVGVWINGTLVDLGIGDGDADPGNVNATNNENLFISNANDDYNTEMDGFTVTMTLKIPVNAGVQNDIKIGIADVSDSSYDSTLLIAGDSIQSSVIAFDDSTTVYPSGTVTVDVLANDQASGTLTITHINNIQVVANDSVILNTGQTVTLNGDGTISVQGDGDTENFNFTYTATDGSNTDTAFVEVSSVPCFVAGTMIRTPDGDRPVESLQPGDLVVTKDDGHRPVRWIGGRTVPAEGVLAPICIRAGTFGAHDELYVSPQHRILVQDSLAELLFGEGEVLVAAKDLVNDRSITRVEGGDVTYVHVMFDRHQVIYSQGLETESFLPGPQTTSLFEADALEEICRIFPELDPNSGAGYSPAARRTLRHYEARLLTSSPRAA
ncbi:MAG: Hint domain-containing protein [Paracoccaceae bacterium]